MSDDKDTPPIETEAVAPEADPAPAPTPEERIAALEAEVASFKDRWLRAEAEMQNLRTRTTRDVPQDPNSSVMYVGAPIRWEGEIVGAVSVGKLAVQGARERELANIYRGNDAARKPDDEDFAEVLSFTRRAFEMAVSFRGAAGNRRPR